MQEAARLEEAAAKRRMVRRRRARSVKPVERLELDNEASAEAAAAASRLAADLTAAGPQSQIPEELTLWGEGVGLNFEVRRVDTSTEGRRGERRLVGRRRVERKAEGAVQGAYNSGALAGRVEGVARFFWSPETSSPNSCRSSTSLRLRRTQRCLRHS